MSQLGVTPDPATLPRGWAPGPPPPTSSKIPMWVVGLAVAVMLAMVAAVAFVLTRDSKPEGPTYPREWDARIAPYARIVEQKRGMFFKHPVAVRFQEPAAFEKGIRGDESKLDKDEKTEIAQFEGLMRAVGLIGGNVDLYKAFDDATGSGTLAYYSFEDKRISIRGERLTPSVKPTLVHELTHALQDQYFDIGAREEALDKKSDSTESSVFDAMVEGDAERIADAYESTLNARQRKALARSEKAEQGQTHKELARIPKIVTTLIGSPYALGEALMQVVATGGGNKAVDKLFAKPPTHESVLLDPFRVPAHNTGAEKVATPKLRSGEKKIDAGEFGALTWYFMLAQRLPVKDALRTVDGWGGDAYLDFERGGTACTRISYVGRSAADTARMQSALQQWKAKAPGAPTTVARNGAAVDFESCDPGKAVLVRKDFSEDALNLAATRAYLGVGFLKAGTPSARSRCVAGKVVDRFSMGRIDRGLTSKDPALTAAIRRFASSC